MLANKLMGGSAEKLYVDDVFSTYLYTGNGSTQTINNGIDLAGEGGLVWIKRRNATDNHRWFDTSRRRLVHLSSSLTNADVTTGSDSFTSFNTSGFSLGADSGNWVNLSGSAYTSWTFRRAPKFFDIVTYTGNGVAGRQIPHGLGIAPGMITTKSTSATGDWNTYHRSATGDLKLNLTNAQTASRAIVTAANDSTFTISGVANTNGVQYVAYLWAHDPSEDGIVQCGSALGDQSQINLGWEPQYILCKIASGGTGDWDVYDSMRGFSIQNGMNGAELSPNTSVAENGVNGFIKINATGFSINENTAATYIYLAIRRPNKPPTSGTEVFHVANPNSGSTIHTTGFPADLAIQKNGGFLWESRLVGDSVRLDSSSTSAETTASSWRAFTLSSLNLMRQVYLNATGIGAGQCGYAFRRAPGFFDIVCYTGTGVARTVPHSLGGVPELMIVKSRSSGSLGWAVYPNDPAKYGVLDSSAGFYNDNTGVVWNSLAPTATHFSVGNGENIVNLTGATFVAYLFASLPGISRVGNYTGNGTSQTIDCGFTTGARFVLIKRTDSTGDWLVADTARGIVAANDPRLSLNSTAAEVTSEDWLDPDPTGFVVNQVAGSNANVSGASYIFLAIA